MNISSLETLITKSVEPVGAAGGEGMRFCRGPGGASSRVAPGLPGGAAGVAGHVPGLALRRTRRAARDVTGWHTRPSRGTSANTEWTDRRLGFGEAGSYAVPDAAGTASAKARSVAMSGPGAERAVVGLSEMLPVPALWIGAEAVLGRGIGLMAAIAVQKD